jgi:predicted O-methyltransferase YrrM
MFTDATHTLPKGYAEILTASQEMGFSMPSDLQTGALLQTLAGAKPGGNILEIGTGTGLATAWLLAGMDADSLLVSIDTEPTYLAVAKQVLNHDQRVLFVCENAANWMTDKPSQSFDLIFADAWPGKYANLDATLNLLKTGGFYIVDDMLPQPNWPDGHGENVTKLVAELESRADLQLVKLAWSTGILIATKK